MKFFDKLFVNPVIQKVLASNIRHLLTLLSGYLVAQSLTDQEGAAKLVEDLTPLLVAAIWAVYSKVHDQKVLSAALLPGVETKEQAKALSKLPDAPKASLAVNVAPREVSALNVGDVPKAA